MKKYDLNKLVCGCDEAGRGALAGPVVAAAVVLPKNFFLKGLNDSKKISPRLRKKMSVIIKNKSFWGIGVINSSKIDTLNILNASIEAMHLAITKVLKKMRGNSFELLLIDGNRFKKYKKMEHKCIIKGDAKYSSIAAASILAKTHRDELMEKLAQENKEYKWEKNKGYPTQGHKLAIKNFGITKYHRKSFKLLETQYALKF